MTEHIKEIIKNISEKEDDFIIEENVDVKEYAKKSRKFQERKYEFRQFHHARHNISITYIPTGIAEIYGNSDCQADEFLEDWRSGVFLNS